MDLQNYNNQYSTENLSSPTYNQTTKYIMTTPKTNKSIQDSKSPMRKLKLKKSKKRECTPAYSPKLFQKEKNLFHFYANTDKKSTDNILYKGEVIENDYKVSQRLSFEDVSCNNFLAGNTLNSNSNCYNLPEEPQKKKFISLIEDSLNDLSDNYYGLLCSQITPDTVFKTIFNEDGKGKNQNVKEYSGEGGAYSAITEILMELKRKNFGELLKMNTECVFFSDDFSCNQLNLSDFFENFLDLAFDVQMSSYSAEAAENSNFLIFVPGNISFASFEHSKNARFVFEVNSREDSTAGQVRLSVIEIQFFS